MYKILKKNAVSSWAIWDFEYVGSTTISLPISYTFLLHFHIVTLYTS